MREVIEASYHNQYAWMSHAKIAGKSQSPLSMSDSPNSIEVLILGASAAGLMCAIEAAKRQRHVLVLDHANKAGKKILMSGGGRCNFTNYDVTADNYISENPHFCKSALSRFTQWNFIQKVEQYQIPYHERDHGQLFCDNSAGDILNMLLSECKKYNVVIQLNTNINSIKQESEGVFTVNTDYKTEPIDITCQSLVIATGGLSIPKMCASPIGYRIAEQFDIEVKPTRAGLVPFTLQSMDKERFSQLSGIAVKAVVSNKRQQFRENILFTHRGLSGPAILQISSYWIPGETISINLLPDSNLDEVINEARKKFPDKKLKTVLSQLLPKRLISIFVSSTLLESRLQHLTQSNIKNIADMLHAWTIKPSGTEGYRTAEVTVGGIDCDALSSKTLASKKIKGLYFIGEVIDVTGWLGGYNFQWAWSSGWCAGQYV